MVISNRLKKTPRFCSITQLRICIITQLLICSIAFPQEYWVSPAGSDSSGNGSQGQPWQHINYAISQIGENNAAPQRILHLLPGLYSPSATGEVFPIEMAGNLWLKGADSSNTVLDAEESSHVISCWQTKGVTISNLAVQGGIFSIPARVGGISCKDGATVEIFECIVQNSKGGIYSGNDSQQYRDSITYVYAHHNLIRNNTTNGIQVTGGDLLCEYNILDGNETINTGSAVATIGGAYRIPHVKIRNNVMKNGISRGGAVFMGNAHIVCEGNLIFNNKSQGFLPLGGGIGVFVLASDTSIIRDNIIVGNMTERIGGGLSIDDLTPDPNNFSLVQRNIIAYNKAYGKGGAIAVEGGYKMVIGGSEGMGNDIFANEGADDVNLFYHGLPLDNDPINCGFNYLGSSDMNELSSWIAPDTMFKVLPFKDSTLFCAQSVNCDSLFAALGLIAALPPSPAFEITKSFKLYKNYPNPFNPDTFIKYDLFKATRVQLKIYNLLGEEINILVNEQQAPGEYQIPWDGKNGSRKGVSSGIYFYRIIIGRHSRVGKMVLIR